jgi:hypothetical protein
LFYLFQLPSAHFLLQESRSCIGLLANDDPTVGSAFATGLNPHFTMKGAAMEHRKQFRGQLGWMLGLLVIGAALMLFACEQPSGQTGDLSKKAPPSLGAISNVDGSDEEKKDEKKPLAGAEQTPAQSPAAGQPAQAAPKQ